MALDSLQNSCLVTIADNFEKYFELLSTTEDVKIKRSFEFLQRAYSYKLVTLLDDEEKERTIEIKYVDFLINSHLKTLDLRWFLNTPWENIIAKIAEIGPNITKILFYCWEQKPWHEIVCHLPNLESMLHRNCSDETLRSIAKFCPNITELDLRDSGYLTEEGFKSLYEVNDGIVPCQKLKRLFVQGYFIEKRLAQCLIKNIPSLEVFDYPLLPCALYLMHSQDLLQPDKIKPYNIVKLNLIPAFSTHYSKKVFSEILKICVTLCPKATCVTSPVFEPEHLNIISEFKYLDTLHLENYQSRENYLDLNNFIKLKGSKLISLALKEFSSLSVLTLAEWCPLLKELVILSEHLESDDCAIPLFYNLEKFTVENAFFLSNKSNFKSVCSILSSSPKLNCIVFKNCNLLYSGIKTAILNCCRLNSINNIDFNHSSVDKPFIMDILKTCHTLRTFDLYDCEFHCNDYEEEIYNCAEILPNKPDVFFSNQWSEFGDDSIYDDDLETEYYYFDLD